MKEQHPELSHVEVNKIVGQLWRNLSDAEKNAYKDKAKVMQETDTSSQHKCPKCDKNFENPNLVISHLMQSHVNGVNNIDVNVDDPMPDQSRIWKCKDCGRMFCNEAKLQDHIANNHSQDNLVEVGENLGDRKEIVWAKVSFFNEMKYYIV